MIDLSIIIVSWNAQTFLRNCLQSICESVNSVNYEILVADNDSSDGSPKMVRNEFPEVKLINSGANFGFAKANNICIKQSRGRYLCLINSDVKLVNDSIEVMLSYMDEHPEVGMLGPKVLNFDKTLQKSVRKFPSYWNAFTRALALDTIFPKSRLFCNYQAHLLANSSPCGVEALTECFLMIRRLALNVVGLLDESYFMYKEDIDWYKRFESAKWKIVYFPRVQVIHYGEASSSNLPVEMYLELKRSTFLYWKKYHGRTGVIYIYVMTILQEVIRMLRAIILIAIPSRDRKKIKHKLNRSLACIVWLINIPASRIKAILT